jgi:hypothetical protein
MQIYHTLGSPAHAIPVASAQHAIRSSFSFPESTSIFCEQKIGMELTRRHIIAFVEGDHITQECKYTYYNESHLRALYQLTAFKAA